MSIYHVAVALISKRKKKQIPIRNLHLTKVNMHFSYLGVNQPSSIHVYVCFLRIIIHFVITKYIIQLAFNGSK